MAEYSFHDVPGKTTFIKFVEYLHHDYIMNSSKWESKTLEDFLEALARNAEDIQGYYDNTNQKVDSNQASWKIFADLLKGASMYE